MNQTEKVRIIAEAGVNHNGDIELAKKLAYEAKAAGADFVKYQTAKVDSLVTSSAKMAAYQEKNTGRVESQYDMLKRLLLPFEAFGEIFDYCRKIGIQPLSTPFDIESIDFLEEMDIPFWKIPSGEITNYPYLVKIAKTKKPIVMSTGMATLEEVSETIALLEGKGASDITLLHCTTEYPTPFEDVNLQAMVTLKKTFHLPIGYSDHTEGILIPIAAVAMGATVIEKHFTLDRNMEGPDHKASLEPDELCKMITSIRTLEEAMGNGIKIPSATELDNAKVARKSLIAKVKISKGELLTEENVTTKRPGDGISPMKWDNVIGTRAIREFAEDEKIEI